MKKMLTDKWDKGPSDDDYADERSSGEKGLRRKVQYNQRACAACRTCEYICPVGVIRIEEVKDGSGLDFAVCHNTCVLCGLCEQYCPTKAISLTDDAYTVHCQTDKYNYVEQGFIKYVPCALCGEPMIPVAPELLALAYKYTESVVYQKAGLCAKCRTANTLKEKEWLSWTATQI